MSCLQLPILLTNKGRKIDFNNTNNFLFIAYMIILLIFAQTILHGKMLYSINKKYESTRRSRHFQQSRVLAR